VKIAQVAPLYESVPPTGYGGTERVISYLSDELVRQGHQVTLFASGDSKTDAELVPCAARALRLDPGQWDPLALHLVEIERVAKREREFDVIHGHLDYLPFSMARRSATPWVSTLHGRLDLPHLPLVHREFSEHPVVAISRSQRSQLPWLSWVDTVYHGLPPRLYGFRAKASEPLLFLGRISPEKRVDRAIEIAARSGRRLRIAAKIDAADRDYYRSIEHLMKHPLVEFLGEISDLEKNEFLGSGAALLFPIDWPEPFGMVMIEALACGTPVIAWPSGSVGEVLTDGVTGFICEDVDAAVAAVDRLHRIDRQRCRMEFERRFTVEVMASRYLEIYRRLMERADPSA
jgi:glycosyltransferase involved in cell wall biosynthesis